MPEKDTVTSYCDEDCAELECVTDPRRAIHVCGKERPCPHHPTATIAPSGVPTTFSTSVVDSHGTFLVNTKPCDDGFFAFTESDERLKGCWGYGPTTEAAINDFIHSLRAIPWFETA